MEMMMMRKARHRKAEPILRAATHIGSIRQHAGNSEAATEAEVDFDTDVLLCTQDPDLKKAAKQLSPKEFFDFVCLSQEKAVSTAADDLKSALAQSTADSPPLLPPLRRLSEIHRLPVAGLSESQRSLIRSSLSHCLATISAPVLSDWMDAALATARRSLATRLVDCHGDIASTTDFELLSLTLTVSQNYTDSDTTGNLSVAMATSGVSLIRLCREVLSAWSREHIAGNLHDNVEQLLRQCISVPYNLYFKQEPKVTSALSQHKLVQCAKPYLSSPDEDVRLSAYLLLVFACSESQAAACLAETRLVELLINRLRLSMQTRDRRCQGYHCVELAKCALRMARNDSNKEQLVDSGLLILLTDMMSSGHADEQLVAMETALCLSFSSACIPRLREQCRAGFNTIRRVLASSGSSESDADTLRVTMEALDFNMEDQAAESLLATRLFSSRCLATKQLDESDSDEHEDEEIYERTSDEGDTAPVKAYNYHEQSEKKSKSSNDHSHVMISYHQATSSNLAVWLRDRLQEAGLSVWLDRDSMQGSTLESMALAVESATAVLVCLSRGYKDSNSCRMEVEYASRRGKRILAIQAEALYVPDGWLGILAGSQLLLDFTKPEAWPANLPRLTNSLRQTHESSRTTPPPPPPTQPQPQVQPPPKAQFLPPSPPHRRAYTNWSVERVADWLRDRSLSPHLQPFRLSGEHLEFFIQLRREAPEAFYRLLETQLRLGSFHELYEFVRALEALEAGKE